MKKAPPVRLSLRKLFIAMLAVGPISILPSPLLAAVPATAPFTPTVGSATWTGGGTNTATITASDRSVLTWGTGAAQLDGTVTSNFVIGTGDTFNFVLPSASSAVLNRVSGNNATTGAAMINGSLLSNGRVVILANGNITIGAGAQVSTTGGLVLSTLSEDSNFSFTSSGSLALTGTSQGNIILGTGASAADIIGSLEASAGNVAANNLTVSGDMLLNSRSTVAVNLTTGAAPTTVGGNLVVTTNNAAIVQGTGALSVVNGNTTLSSGTGAITLETATNDFKTLFANTTSLAGNVAIRDANIISLGASTIGGDLRVTAGGNGGNTAIASTGALTIGGNAHFIQNTTGNSGVSIAHSSSVGGQLLANVSNSAVSFNGVGNLTTGAINVSAGARSELSITTNGALTVAGAIDVTGTADRGSITLTGASINQTGNVTTVLGNGTVSLNATSGNISLANVTNTGTGGVSLRTAGGNISQASSTLITTSNVSQTSTINVGTGTANLTNANAFAAGSPGSILQITAGNATINNTGSAGTLRIGTTNVTNNLTILNDSGNNNVILGVGTGTGAQNVTVTGNLNVTVAGTGTITDGDFGAFNIGGGLNLTAGTGAVTLDAAVANGGLAPSVQLGQVRVNSSGSAITVAERTTLNLGNMTGASLNATSTQGDIINTGDLAISGTANFTTSGASTSVITNGTNSIGTANFIGSGGALTVGSGGVTLGSSTNVSAGDDLLITSTNGGNITLSGATIGGSLMVTSANAVVVAGDTSTTVGGNLSLTAANSGATSIDATAVLPAVADGRLIVSGETTIASSGGVVLKGGNDFMGGVVLNQAGSTGGVEIYDINNLTISGAAGGAVDARAGATSLSIDAPWNLVLGNIAVASLLAVAGNGGGGNSGTLTQASGTSFNVNGNFTAATTNGAITLANSQNSAGRVSFITNGNVSLGATTTQTNASATINYAEDNTVRLGNVASNSNITIRSNFGSVVEDTTVATNINSRATMNVSAPNGNIHLGNTTTTTTTTTANIAAFIANAPSGAVAVTGNNNIALGNIAANSLVVTATNNITQTGVIHVFGAANFTTTATGDARVVTLTNNANNFGPISVTLGNATGTVTVNEDSTLNLRRITMLGGGNATITATSVNGDIIDTGFAGVVLGGNATTPGSGVVTLTAVNGNITLDDPSTDIRTSSGLAFNAKDVTLSVLGNVAAPLVLGAASAPSTATGNLTVTNLLGGIANAGAMTAGGTAFFQTPSGNINIGSAGVGFGILRFIGQQVSIAEAGNMDIATGSSATGAANLVSSGGNIGIVNIGGGAVTFASTVNLTANGNITPGNLLQAAGLLRVSHTGTANLGGLSIGSNLNGITPVDAGTGPYVAPNP